MCAFPASLQMVASDSPPCVVLFADGFLHLLPVSDRPDAGFLVQGTMQLVMGELVGEAEPEASMPVLHHESIDVDVREVAGQEGVDLEVVENPLQRNNFDLEIELDDFLDGDREGALVVELGQELFGAAPDVLVTEDLWPERHATPSGWSLSTSRAAPH